MAKKRVLVDEPEVKKEEIRFHSNANGIEVMVSGKWLPADEAVLNNLAKMLHERF